MQGKKITLLVIALLLYASLVHAAGWITISGTVTDENGKPLAGANVVVKGQRRGATTDAKGQFTIQAEEGSILVISSIGYIPQELPASGTPQTIRLKENSKMLEEVYVGYQRLRKSDVTGAISSVKASELNLSTPTISQALVGKVAGVQVSQVSGAPYGGAKIRVRGVGSINASSEPLYVIDGYPVGGNITQGQGNGGNATNGYNPGTSGNDVFINPDDIESIEILKDAASAAIYGSRASGGVVLITTKRGKIGKGVLKYDLQLSRQQLAKKVKLLNASQFTDLFVNGRNANYKDILIAKGIAWDDAFYSDDNATRVTKTGQTKTGCSVCIIKDLYDFPTQTIRQPKYNTDWQDVLYGNASVQRHNLSFTGGSENTRYLISGGYLDQPGILNSTYQKRINLRANIDADLTPKLKVSSSVFVTNTDNREVQEGRFNQGPILGALVYMPIFPAFNPDGTLATADKGAGAQTDGFAYAFQGIENPLALAQRVKITRKGTRATYIANATYQIINGLAFRVNLGGETYSEKYEYYYPTNLSSGINPPGSTQSITAANASAQNLTTQDRLAEFTLNYKKTFGLHRFDALGGYTAQESKQDIVAVATKDFTSDNIQEITAGGSVPGDFSLQTNSGKSTTTLLSYLGRVIYSYNNRYFLSGSFRTDASSRFGPKNKWGQFGSVSAGWSLSSESFYHDWLGRNSSLKLRASWGLTGNNNIPNYKDQQYITGAGGVVVGNTVYNANWAGDIADPSLGWESTSQYNFGLDATVLNNRVSFFVNYYLSKSYNLLYNRNISAISGSTTYTTNLRNSNIHNTGVDLQVDVKAIQTKVFNLNFSGNITANKNKVISLGGASEIQTNGAERSYITHVTREGAPVGSFYGVKVAGMVREKDMAGVIADQAVYKANGGKFPPGYKLQAFPISTFSSTPLNPGDLYFKDKNGDGLITDADKDVIGSPYPDFTYGFSINANYKAFDFSASFNGSQGNKILDGQDYYIRNMEGSGNQYAVIDQRYRNEQHPGNGHEYRSSRGGTQSNSTRLSDYYLQNGSFFRCTNISTGVNLTQLVGMKNTGISGLRIYVSVDNVFTVTKYLGYNPEVDFNNGSNLTPGVDYGKYPLARSFNTGIKIQF
ncbi:TonB-dependent receptor [Flavitalea sp. BT771]|uniref:SusC/RagA family TonB-linked outer membrane protein n=1 Tax=Flavitalea sp. BT771 TaxID=3063329 RepID=UPI0026E2EBB1|nr:TonB-dependent receptor [Flavitalea sp. BT771]MDO6430425.1 TonB-dependent receptor [Flavitalea sp. BT771]MDV6219435.1 TonB-dependent receptor [Flavitalea sp. BT771]